ncbi:MAG: putative capsular polysaccharide synthesis family protein [Pseudomonadota bacterium]
MIGSEAARRVLNLYEECLANARVARWASTPDPILIFTMPKTGSTSLERALAASGGWVPKIHALGAYSNYLRGKYASRGVPTPTHLRLEAAIGRRLERLRGKLRIISLVRDPVRRDISGLFQAPGLLGIHNRDVQGFAAEVNTRIADGTLGQVALNWFPRSFEPATGYDMLEQPFDRAAGWQRYEIGQNSVLILKSERLDDLSDVVSEFTGHSISLKHENTRRETREAGVYADVLSGVQIPEALLDRIYQSEFVRHFYTAAEIQDMRQRWVTRRGADL